MKKVLLIAVVLSVLSLQAFAQETNSIETKETNTVSANDNPNQGEVLESSDTSNVAQPKKKLLLYYLGYESYQPAGSTAYLGFEADFGQRIYFGANIKAKAMVLNGVPFLGKGGELNPKLGFAILRPVNTKGFNILAAAGFYLDYYTFSDSYGNSLTLFTYGPTFDITFDLITSKTLGFALTGEYKLEIPDSISVIGVNLGLNLAM